MQNVRAYIYPDEYLYSRLKALADLERRSLNQQVLHMLEEYLAHVEALEGANGLPFTSGGQPERTKYEQQ